MDPDRARQLLEAERDRLQGIIDSGQGGDFGEAEQAASSDVLSYDSQPADAAQETFERERDFSVIGHAEAELGEVEHALRKLDEGTYGLDERTGEPIPDERLEARPATRYTVANQELDEKQAGVQDRAGAPNERAAPDPTATSGGGRLAR